MADGSTPATRTPTVRANNDSTKRSTVTIAFSVHRSIRDAAVAIAEQDGDLMSTVLRRALRRGLESEKRAFEKRRAQAGQR